MCGNCCKFGYKTIGEDTIFFLGVELNKDDRVKIEKRFYKRYHDAVHKHYYWFLNWKEDDSCIFLENNKCNIHENKPSICKQFPFNKDRNIVKTFVNCFQK